MKRFIIGIDVGGTKTAYGVFDEERKILATRRHSSNPKLAPEEFFDVIVENIQALCTECNIAPSELCGVGIGMPSFIHFDEGRIIKTVNLTRLKDFRARDYLQRELGRDIQIVLDNDSHTGALAEHRHGAGRNFQHMLYCPVSTGISSGIIIDGRLFHGSYGWSGESGHMIVTPGEGIMCGCENVGCLMSWCSGSMIVKHVQSWINSGEKTLMTELAGSMDTITTEHIGECFVRGDALATRAVEQMTTFMAVWIYNLYVTLNINCFVFGGGLLNMKGNLLDRIKDKFDAYNKNDMPVYFKTAELGENFGIIGAAELIEWTSLT